jgi:hypothetical protein
MNLVWTEQRENSRFSLKVPLRIHLRCGELVMGHTVEVSEVGLSAMIPVALPSASHYAYQSECGDHCLHERHWFSFRLLRRCWNPDWRLVLRPQEVGALALIF